VPPLGTGRMLGGCDGRGEVRKGWVRGERLHRSFEAVCRCAGGADRLLALFIQDSLGGGVHPCLASERFP
jgi:hypothetical protein